MIYKNKYLDLKEKCEPEVKPEVKPDLDNLLDQQTKKFINSLKDKTPIYKLSITDARKVLNDIQVNEDYITTIDIEEFTVPISNIISSKKENNDVQIKIYRPKNNKDYLPVIIYYHGGGWILGNNQTHGRLMSELANKAKAAVVFIGYSLAPEKKYPVQLIQADEATKYIINNSSKHNLNTNKLIVMGDSVGGNMATIIALLSNERHYPKINYQILLYPVTDSLMITESYKLYSDGPWLTKGTMEWFYNAYENDKDNRKNPLISPLNVPLKYMSGLPPTLIISSENDVLRDETEQYAHKLMQANVEVTAVRYLGTIHDFMMLDPLRDTPSAKSAMKLIVAHIKEVFYNDN